MEEAYLEHEFEKDLLEVISKNYKTKDFFLYMILRYLTINNLSYDNDFNIRDFSKFIKEANNLPNEFLYQGEQISDETFIKIISNLILDTEKSLISRAENTLYDLTFCANETIENIKLKALKEVAKYKKTEVYNDILLLTRLKRLNSNFDITININFTMKNLNYIGFKEKISLEKLLEEKIESKLKGCISIEESILEEYIKSHLDLIETGLTYISSQYPIKNAYIDILAKDSIGNTVIIELKTKDDERLIWQSLYYPKQYKKEHINENIRMITLCSNYPNHILSVLNDISFAEKMEYHLELKKDGTINNIEIKRL